MRYAETWSEARVRSVTGITPSIRLLDIEPAGEAPTSFPLGGHLNVAVLIDGKPDTRSYSLIDAPGCYRIAVKLQPEGRGGSSYMWSLAPGARLTVSNPCSNFELEYGRPDYLLVAGGIGITPIYAMALALARRSARVRLAYAVRSRAELAFADALGAALGDRLTTFVSAEGQRLDLAAALTGVAADGLALVCGPLPMLDSAKRIWKSLGRPATDLRYETFGSSGAHAPEPFRIRVPELAHEIVVPETKSMLDALAEAGIEVISDCRRGECGVCAVNILAVDGTVDHRDVFFSDQQKQQNRKICVCVSRAIGTITIDPLFRPEQRP